MSEATPTLTRFWRRVDKIGWTGCWLWSGAKNDKGYGQLKDDRSVTIYAHRFAYEQFLGAIPDGLQIDHLCRVRHCVNPAHLEAVTPRENQLRGEGQGGKNARKTHCIHGHELVGDNVYIRKDNGGRMCRVCNLARKRANYQRRAS